MSNNRNYNRSMMLTGNNAGRVTRRPNPPLRPPRQLTQRQRAARRRRNQRRNARRRQNSAARTGDVPIFGLGQSEYTLAECINKATIDYAEAVVCPFNPRGLGAIRPDEVMSTSAGTDKLQLIIPYTKLQEAAADPNVQQVYPNLSFIGVAMWFNPRCAQAGWFDAQSTEEEKAYTMVKTKVGHRSLNSTLTVAGGTAGIKDGGYGPAYAYTIGFALLGNDGRFYAYTPLIEGLGEPSTTLIRGYNTISTTRIDLVDQNFTSIRVLGTGMKLWSNAPPIQTGGYAFGGEIALQDLYQIIAGENNSLTSQSVQDALKHRTKYLALDGVTTRYNSIAEMKSKVMQEVYIQDINVNTVEGSSSLGPTDDLYYAEDEYTITNETEFMSKDLASQSTMVPIIVWQYGSNDPYDLSFESIIHVEGRTVGNCPFEIQQELVDPNLEHLDKFLRHSLFPISARGHSFRTFLEKAKKMVGKGNATMANVVRIGALLEKFLGDI